MTKDFLIEDVPGGAKLLVRLRKRDALHDDRADRHRNLLDVLLRAVGSDGLGIDAGDLSQPVHAFPALGALLGRVGDDRARLPAPAASAHLGSLQVAARTAVGRRRALAAGYARARTHWVSLALGHGRLFRVAGLAQHRRPGADRRSVPAAHRARRRRNGNRDDQPLLRTARLADAGGACSCWSARTWRSSATTVPRGRSSTIGARCGRDLFGRTSFSWTAPSR